MPVRRGRSFPRSGAARRRTTWATVDTSISIPAANDYNTIDLLANFKTDGGVQQAVTVTRTHLRIIPQATAPVAGNNFYVGLLRGQMSDVGANIAGAPAPATQPYEDWILWDHLWYDGGLTIDAFGGNQLHYDLKAMRRLEELQMNYNLVIQVAAAAAFPAVFDVTGRVLLKLP